MRILATTLLVLGAVIITYTVTRFGAFMDFSPHAGSETAGFVVFRGMVAPFSWGMVIIIAAAVCFWRARKK